MNSKKSCTLLSLSEEEVLLSKYYLSQLSELTTAENWKSQSLFWSMMLQTIEGKLLAE